MSPYKSAFKSASLGTQAPALVRALLRGRTLDCPRSPRGTRRSPAARASLGVGGPEPQTGRKRGDRRTKKRRKTPTGGNANAFPNLLPFTSKGNERPTDTQTTLR